MLDLSSLNQLVTGGGDPSGFSGIMPVEALQEITKALAVGSDRDPPASYQAGDGFAYRVENLDPVERTITFTEKNIIMWKLLPKQGVDNTVFEWNEVQSYGQDGMSGFIADGSLPEVHDTTIARRHGYVKYMAVQGSITHVSTLVKTAGNVNLVAAETQKKMLQLLGMIERSLMDADEGLDAGAWSGFPAQLRAAVNAGIAPRSCITDKRGAPLTVQDVELASADAASEPRYGNLSDIFAPPLVKAGMNVAQYPALRGQQGVGSTGGAIGASFNTIQTSTGELNIHPMQLLTRTPELAVSGLGDATRRPAAPILSVAPATASDAASQFISTDAGDYGYSVVARNRFGASVPLSLGTVTVAAGQRMRVSVQAAPGPQTLWFEVFRTTRNGTIAYRIARFANPSAGFTVVQFDDLNATLPGTYEAMAFDWNPLVVSFKQLAPTMKMALAQIDFHQRWAQLIYGTPILQIARRAQLFTNLGVVTA
jgi:hypothetical protein